MSVIIRIDGTKSSGPIILLVLLSILKLHLMIWMRHALLPGRSGGYKVRVLVSVILPSFIEPTLSRERLNKLYLETIFPL